MCHPSVRQSVCQHSVRPGCLRHDSALNRTLLLCPLTATNRERCHAILTRYNTILTDGTQLATGTDDSSTWVVSAPHQPAEYPRGSRCPRLTRTDRPTDRPFECFARPTNRQEASSRPDDHQDAMQTGASLRTDQWRSRPARPGPARPSPLNRLAAAAPRRCRPNGQSVRRRQYSLRPSARPTSARSRRPPVRQSAIRAVLDAISTQLRPYTHAGRTFSGCDGAACKWVRRLCSARVCPLSDHFDFLNDT